MRRTRIATLALCCVLSQGCGDDPVPAEGDGDVTEDVQGEVTESQWFDGNYSGTTSPGTEACADTVDNDSDGSADCLDEECSERLICTDVLTNEVEPNNSTEDAQSLTLPAVVRGEVGVSTQDDDGDWKDDPDWYTFEISAPTVLIWSFDDANGPALLRLSVVGLDDETDHVTRRLDIDTPGATRQTYLDTAGVYGLEVRDIRNTRRSSEEVAYGGPEFVYAFSLETSGYEEEAIELPFDGDESTLGDGNALRVYSTAVEAGDILEVEVTSERLDPSSGLDALVYVLDASDQSVVQFQDDPSTSTVDPIVRTGVFEADTQILVIVDAYEIRDETRFAFRAEVLEPSIDGEPNNPIDLGYPIELGVTVEGEISAPILDYRTTRTDRDNFYLSGGPSTSYLIEVTATGDNLDASVRTGFLGYSRGFPVLGEVFTADPSETSDVRLEVTGLFDRRLYLEVADRRNLYDRDIDPVGGDEGFEYELTVTAIERTIAEIEIPHDESYSIDQAGEADWYSVTAPEHTRLNISASAGEGDFEPRLYLATEEDIYIRRATAETTNYLSTFETPYRLAVVDAGGEADRSYQLVVNATAFDSSEESEPNDGPPEGGQILEGEGPWWVTGETDGDNEEDADRDVFVVSIPAERLLVIETTEGADSETDDADTLVTVTGGDLEEAASDDDAGLGNFSRLEVETLEGGTFEITVTPVCDSDECSGGDYSIAVWTEDIPEPEEDEE